MPTARNPSPIENMPVRNHNPFRSFLVQLSSTSNQPLTLTWEPTAQFPCFFPAGKPSRTVFEVFSFIFVVGLLMLQVTSSTIFGIDSSLGFKKSNVEARLYVHRG
ncbi:uncharacterized protein BT62DRAFT_1007702 [Guyanagaster necrorhizus]|uniref:Uncharacterized protein n=1 Tax=Guyanagaster necrorhizus TaxID=856835 RepID=A0A9P7VQ70_9AGAR|nr:uncharacterized protein BT62DRAFT_1007702 [Guyanagaster necrorhizus MCA 3950]KAG7444670.1 hypothetical protein BT62DRAFT_1007702 [Guyanagaster necrorhizus MCA 3950]